MVSGAIICCTVVDRLKSDQITASHETLEEWQMRPQRVVAKYIRQQLGLE
jgi:uridine phosphorylase